VLRHAVLIQPCRKRAVRLLNKTLNRRGHKLLLMLHSGKLSAQFEVLALQVVNCCAQFPKLTVLVLDPVIKK
jgi:hypothetical protein